MKKIFSFLILLAGVASLTSCSEKDATYTAPTPLAVSKADVLFGAGGGDGSIVTAAQSAVTATTDAQWISLSTDGGTVAVTAQPNASLEARSAKIVVKSADGATANVTAIQHGLLLALNAEDVYLLNGSGNDPVLISDKSNVDFSQVISDEWIHLEKTDGGYALTVDPNEDGYRHGTIQLSYEASGFSKTINVGESLPFTALTTATYEDEEGNTYEKAVTVVADESDANGNTYLIKGLMAEGDLAVTLNTKTTDIVEYYVAAGYTPGKLTEDGTTYTLRCLMSVYNVNTGGRYYPTQVTTLETSPYRMAFEWQVDENAMPVFTYVRNADLAANYRTDGIIVCKFSTPSGASAAARKGIAYQFLNLRLF